MYLEGPLKTSDKFLETRVTGFFSQRPLFCFRHGTHGTAMNPFPTILNTPDRFPTKPRLQSCLASDFESFDKRDRHLGCKTAMLLSCIVRDGSCCFPSRPATSPHGKTCECQAKLPGQTSFAGVTLCDISEVAEFINAYTQVQEQALPSEDLDSKSSVHSHIRGTTPQPSKK